MASRPFFPAPEPAPAPLAAHGAADLARLMALIDAGGPHSWASALTMHALAHRFPVQTRARLLADRTRGLEVAAFAWLTPRCGERAEETAAACLAAMTGAAFAPGGPRHAALQVSFLWYPSLCLYALPWPLQEGRWGGGLNLMAAAVDTDGRIDAADWAAFLADAPRRIAAA